MSNFSFLNSEDGMREIVAHNPERFSGALDIAENLLRGKSELSVAERELVFAYVSGLNSCAFCFEAHKAVAEVFGIDEGRLNQLLNSETPSHADKRLQPCLDLAKKAARESYRIERSDIETVTNGGWSEETAHDLISIAALATYSNILVSGHGVTGSPVHFKQVVKTLGPGGGYRKG